MSSDSTTSTSLLTVIPLGTAFLHAPYISAELITLLEGQLQTSKKTLLFYNRRGNARAWICQDCGHFEKCPHCDIALAYHTTPSKRLICHQCNTVAPFLIECPHCHGSKIAPVGTGIQQIEDTLKKLLHLQDDAFLRIDSDMKMKASEIYHSIDTAQVILSTSLGSTIIHPDIDTVVYLSFELNLSLPEYDMEEDIYRDIVFHKRQGLSLYIQTYTPDHPLLNKILFDTSRSFLDTLKKERKDFGYPPYKEFATIRIHDERKERVQDMMGRVLTKILPLKRDSTFLAYDRDIWDKQRGEWTQKIILKDVHLSYILSELEVEIVRNRSVTLEWN